MKSENAKVLVLGTFHMAEHEDLYSEKRQIEIEDLVSKLASFKPTKIAVEMAVDKTELLNNKYRKYNDGTYNLEMNEIFQIGFRLGRMLKHEEIYPIDWIDNAGMEYGDMEKWAKENQPELFSEIYDGIYIPELTDNTSILDYYRELNDPSWLNTLHKMYVNIARIGDFNNYVGMKWLSWWYKRNLIMFSNLTRLINIQEERILFIVGCSHSTIVNKFIEESEVCKVVQPLNYLT
ncbi:DUF5694 domain-containing protein [Oceanobacillus luteolus]|uniref:DUF5694 domain-containing protein n=1 Tax=Oceanobacillus luteolus TaxID=1274358 RepID=A0ABW4HTF1_9BACI|nr:DUF5694 domain-containing protein [Oceanobacillus luteolus]MCM3741888.1 DUF5694 domain-containing protein [Oceanobacillus luteolus]